MPFSLNVCNYKAKDALCQKIDDYIRDRIIIADEVIQELAGNKIKDGDVILTYARSLDSSIPYISNMDTDRVPTLDLQSWKRCFSVHMTKENVSL